ncbi:family 16 glycoside hydrolase [Streptomyces sp. HNM0575]|uniref:OmpL47-type beta-barrel domain-containing protein n=1 Tax=Streptomyces sp. HNM0575 TaxID=2716338 RepID=UPI001F10B72E|nr:family 16 glycoside hydrolase [Streptomyces sp. HNM0575]
MVVGLASAPAYGQQPPAGGTAAAQLLRWTAGDDITHYTSAPETAVAGPATIEFENSEATGNTTSMPHTLTFVTGDPDYNDDVNVNILANPSDAQGGKHSVEVTLTPGTYKYHCTIPGHAQMQGTLVVTDGGGGDDTTPPETSAKVAGDQNADGEYVGMATVTVTASDAGSGVNAVEYALGDGGYQAYTEPVMVHETGAHTFRYRATDKAGNVAEEKTVEFTVVAPPTDDTTPPETSATVDGEQDADGAYIGMATVTVTASDAGSGVNTVQYALGDGEFQPYTAPVMVHEPGTYTFRYKATDKAGNAAETKSAEFTVVEQPEEDTTPPETTAKTEGGTDSDGAYIGRATVTVTATDEESGVDKVEYSLDGGPFLAYSGPVVVDRTGHHSVAHRATDKAGNTSQAVSESFDVVPGGGVPAPDCPEFDERATVFVGDADTGVPNRMTKRRCTVGELIEDEKDWSSHALFVKHVTEVTGALLKEKVLDSREAELINRTAGDSEIGEPGQQTGYKQLFDGTKESFERWQHVGGGAFALNGDGSMTSSTETEGMGMLWYPKRKFADYSLKLQFRDDAPGDGNANSGVFARFPYVHDNPEEPRPEWVAIKFGHELQILDKPDGDMYKTGSVYGFDRVGLGGAGVTPKGTWNDYEVKVVGQHYSVYRNGELINEFDNGRGQVFEPPRDDDPGTDGRRYASGYIGLQVHSVTDVISYRDVRIKEL